MRGAIYGTELFKIKIDHFSEVPNSRVTPSMEVSWVDMNRDKQKRMVRDW